MELNLNVFPFILRGVYRKGANKVKVHLGFDIGRGIPQKRVLTHGKGDERSTVEQLVTSGQAGVYDRGYQSYKTLTNGITRAAFSFVVLKKVPATPNQ